MCDVTVDNFEEALARLRTIVPQSDFVSIDLEFTGLDQDVYNDASASSEGAPAANAGDAAAGGGAAGSGSKWFGGGPSFPGAPFDMRKEAQAKYSKMCETTKFLVVQVGVCPFVYNPQKKVFVASPFNFYVFPCEFRGIDRRFMCQTRCMQFLSNSSLDFNKLFKSGVPFLSHQEEELIRGSGGKDAVFIEGTRAALVDFICDSSQASLVLPPADGFHRMLIYRELTDIFGDVLKHERASMNGEMCVKVHRTERTASLGNTREAIHAAVVERARIVNEKQINTAIGFRHVMDLLVAMHKPIIGHNMLLDMMQLEAHFCRDLPADLTAFKASLHQRFPCLIDTKHMLAAAPPSLAKYFSAGSRLDMVYRTVCSDPFKKPNVQLEQGFERYRGQRLHEAGYDAYMTGVAYMRIAHHLVMTAPSLSTAASPRLGQTGLTPRLREMGGVHGHGHPASHRPSSVMLETLIRNGYCNKLHVVGCSKVLYFDFDGGFERDFSPLSDSADCALSSPKRMRPISQDLDTSIEHEEATRRARGMAGVGGVGGGAEPGSSHGTLKTPPHQICVARHRVREALDNSASKKPQEKRPRMSI